MLAHPDPEVRNQSLTCGTGNLQREDPGGGGPQPTLHDCGIPSLPGGTFAPTGGPARTATLVLWRHQTRARRRGQPSRESCLSS
jgi:hypothetical protein